MEKKYSIQTQDGQVVSIEVDGETYAHPEDIPDERDREQILVMIARAESGDDDSLEQDFQRELREMQQRPAPLPRLLLVLFGGIALLMLVITVVSTISTLRLLAREQSAPGQVVEMVERTRRDSETGEVSTYSYPVVEFAAAGQPSRQVQLDEGSWPPSYVVGDEVVVLYDPLQPRSARIRSSTSAFTVWILPGVTFIVGAAFALAAWMVLKLILPRK